MKLTTRLSTALLCSVAASAVLAAPQVIVPSVGPASDASRMTVTGTGTITPRTQADIAADQYQAKAYGAICDGSSHPLSAYYASLGAAQAVYPEATALTNEMDWAATQRALNAAAATGAGGSINLPFGASCRLSAPLVCPTAVTTAARIWLRGQGHSTTLQPTAALSQLILMPTSYCFVENMRLVQDDTSALATYGISITKPLDNLPVVIQDVDFTKGTCSTCVFTAGVEVQRGDNIGIYRGNWIGGANSTAILFDQLLGNSFGPKIDHINVLGGNGIDFNCSGNNHAEGMFVTNNNILPATTGTFGIRAQCGVALTLAGNIVSSVNNGIAELFDATNHPISGVAVLGDWLGGGQTGTSLIGTAVYGPIHGLTQHGVKHSGFVKGMVVDGGTLTLTTNGSTAAGNAVLNFASGTGTSSTGNSVTPCSVTWLASAASGDIPANTTVSSCTGTTITLSANTTGSGVASGEVITFWQQANEVSSNSDQFGVGGGTASNTTGDLYLNNAPGFSSTQSVFTNTGATITESGTTVTGFGFNSFPLGATIVANAASQYAFNYRSAVDGLQVAGGSSGDGAKITAGSGALVYGTQGTGTTPQVQAKGDHPVQLVTNGAVRFTAGSTAQGSITLTRPTIDFAPARQDFSVTATITFGSGTRTVWNTSASSVAGATTITLPTNANSLDGMILDVICGAGLGSPTFAANTGQTVKNAPATCPAGGSVHFEGQLVSGNMVWQAK